MSPGFYQFKKNRKDSALYAKFVLALADEGINYYSTVYNFQTREQMTEITVGERDKDRSLKLYQSTKWQVPPISSLSALRDRLHTAYEENEFGSIYAQDVLEWAMKLIDGVPAE